MAVLLEKAVLYQTLDRSVDVNRCQSDSIANLLLRQRQPKWLILCYPAWIKPTRKLAEQMRYPRSGITASDIHNPLARN
nr:hypothetical protein [Sphingomonas sp. FUKUSWIS1]